MFVQLSGHAERVEKPQKFFGRRATPSSGPKKKFLGEPVPKPLPNTIRDSQFWCSPSSQGVTAPMSSGPSAPVPKPESGEIRDP